MMEDKLIKYLIFAMIIFSAAFYFGAYFAGFIAFIILFKKDPRYIINSVFKKKVVLFLTAALILSTLFSKVPGYSLMIAGIIVLHFMVYSVVVSFADNENIEGIYRLLNAMGILISFYGIYQYFTGDLTIIKSWTDQGTFGSLTRIYSTFRNPNIFAAYLTFNICYSAAYFLKKKGDIYTAINIMFSSISLILTYSRGGFISFVAAILVIGLICREWKVFVYLAVMILINYGYNFYESANRTVLTTLAFDSSSLYRLEIWKASWSLFKESILFGNGLGSVSKLLSFSSYKLNGYIAHSHNIVLNILAETGLFGLTAFLTMIFSGINKFLQFMRSHKHSENSYIAIGFIAALTAMLVHGMVDSVVLIPSRSLIFLIYLALLPAMHFRTCSKQSA